jgi:hypothetical protein
VKIFFKKGFRGKTLAKTWAQLPEARLPRPFVAWQGADFDAAITVPLIERIESSLRRAGHRKLGQLVQSSIWISHIFTAQQEISPGIVCLFGFGAGNPKRDYVVTWREGSDEQFLRECSSFTWLHQVQISMRKVTPQIVITLGIIDLNECSSSFCKANGILVCYLQ